MDNKSKHLNYVETRLLEVDAYFIHGHSLCIYCERWKKILLSGMTALMKEERFVQKPQWQKRDETRWKLNNTETNCRSLKNNFWRGIFTSTVFWIFTNVWITFWREKIKLQIEDWPPFQTFPNFPKSTPVSKHVQTFQELPNCPKTSQLNKNIPPQLNVPTSRKYHTFSQNITISEEYPVSKKV